MNFSEHSSWKMGKIKMFFKPQKKEEKSRPTAGHIWFDTGKKIRFARSAAWPVSQSDSLNACLVLNTNILPPKRRGYRVSSDICKTLSGFLLQEYFSQSQRWSYSCCSILSKLNLKYCSSSWALICTKYFPGAIIKTWHSLQKLKIFPTFWRMTTLCRHC